jgi:hypothetical protein
MQMRKRIKNRIITSNKNAILATSEFDSKKSLLPDTSDDEPNDDVKFEKIDGPEDDDEYDDDDGDDLEKYPLLLSDDDDEKDGKLKDILCYINIILN